MRIVTKFNLKFRIAFLYVLIIGHTFKRYIEFSENCMISMSWQRKPGNNFTD